MLAAAAARGPCVGWTEKPSEAFPANFCDAQKRLCNDYVTATKFRKPYRCFIDVNFDVETDGGL